MVAPTAATKGNADPGRERAGVHLLELLGKSKNFELLVVGRKGQCDPETDRPIGPKTTRSLNELRSARALRVASPPRAVKHWRVNAARRAGV
jgi:hypothetical protein